MTDALAVWIGGWQVVVGRGWLSYLLTFIYFEYILRFENIVIDILHSESVS